MSTWWAFAKRKTNGKYEFVTLLVEGRNHVLLFESQDLAGYYAKFSDLKFDLIVEVGTKELEKLRHTFDHRYCGQNVQSAVISAHRDLDDRPALN